MWLCCWKYTGPPGCVGGYVGLGIDFTSETDELLLLIGSTAVYYLRAFTTLAPDTAAGRRLALLSAEMAEMAEAIMPCFEQSAQWMNCWIYYNKPRNEVQLWSSIDVLPLIADQAGLWVWGELGLDAVVWQTWRPPVPRPNIVDTRFLIHHSPLRSAFYGHQLYIGDPRLVQTYN